MATTDQCFSIFVLEVHTPSVNTSGKEPPGTIPVSRSEDFRDGFHGSNQLRSFTLPSVLGGWASLSGNSTVIVLR